MKKHIGNSKGFTLIEIMCVVALLGLISVSSYSIFTGAATGQQKSKNQLDANAIAQTVMEDLIERGEKITSVDDLPDYSSMYGYDVEIDITRAEEALQSRYENLNVKLITPRPASTGSPGSSAKPGGGQKATPVPTGMIEVGPEFSDYNAMIEIFDYCDYDLYDIIQTGLILLYGNTEAGASGTVDIDFGKVFDLMSFDEFDKYYNEMSTFQNYSSNPSKFRHFETDEAKALLAKYGIDNNRYEWLKPCFTQLDCDDIAFLMNKVMGQYKDNLKAVKGEIFNGGWASQNAKWPATTADVEALWEKLLKEKPKKCYHTERGYTCNDHDYTYEKDGETIRCYNAFETLGYYIDHFLDIEETVYKYSWGNMYSYTHPINQSYYDSSEFAPLLGSSAGIEGGLWNCHTYMNRHKFHGGTTTGPWLIMKFYNKEKGIIKLNDSKKLIFITPTEQGSDRQDIYFQIYPRQLVFQKGNLTFSTEPGQNVLGINTIDLNQGGWYQSNIFGQMVFFVRGGLTYRETTFGLFGDGTGFLDRNGDTYPDYYDPETDSWKSTVTFETDDDGNTLYAKVNSKGEYVLDSEGNYQLTDSSNGLPIIKESMISLGFKRHLFYDYFNTYNDTLSTYAMEARSLLNLTDFTRTKPSWFGLNMDPPTGNNNPGGTPVPTGDPGSTPEPEGTPSSELDYTGYDIPGKYNLMLKFKVDVYEKGHKSSEDPLSTLVSFCTGSPNFTFGTPIPATPNPDASPTPTPDSNIHINFSSTPEIEFANGDKNSYGSESQLTNMELIITNDNGDFSFNINGSSVIDSSSSKLNISRNGSGKINKVTIFIDGELTAAREISVSKQSSSIEPDSTEYVIINATTGSELIITNNTGDVGYITIK